MKFSPAAPSFYVRRRLVHAGTWEGSSASVKLKTLFATRKLSALRFKNFPKDSHLSPKPLAQATDGAARPTRSALRATEPAMLADVVAI